MNKFNLTFWGEILPGRDPAKVKARFAKMFDIRDPEQLERFFSGETIILRRNIERKVAAEYYAKLRKLGVEAELRKIDASGMTSEPDAPRKVEESAEQESQSKQAKWEEARLQAEQEAQERIAREPQRKLESSRQRQQRERRESQEAQWKARQQKLEREQLAQAARRKAEREKQAMLRKEKARRKQEEAAARARQLAEEEAQRQAAAATIAQRKAEEAARKQAEADERARVKAEQRARKEAEAEAQRRAKAEAEARRKAEARQRKAEEEARRREDQARREAEAEKRRAEKAARKKAEQEAAAKRKAEKEAAAKEKARLLGEKKAREAAERREREQAEALVAAKAAEQKRIEQQKIERQRVEEAARRQREADARRAAQEAEREARRAEKAHIKQQEEARKALELALEKERETERQRLEEQAIVRGAAELASQASLRSREGTVRSAMELPRRGKLGQGPVGKRQTGAPNDYRTHPFRNNAEVRGRAELARETFHRTLAIAAAVLAVALLLSGRYISLDPVEPVSGPAYVLAASNGTLLVQAADMLLIHDRSGVGRTRLSLTELGLAAGARSLTFTPASELLLWASEAENDAAAGLWRCDLSTRQCNSLANTPLQSAPDAVAVHELNGQLFAASAAASSLLKLSPEGSVLAEVDHSFTPGPALRLDQGLMLINSAEGPAVGVFRYEDQAFGKQLDEVLLLPPQALAEAQTRVRDFVRSGDYWWVNLYNPETGSAGLYLFDSDWKYLRDLPAPDPLADGRLLRWGQKVLLFHPGTTQILRFSETGEPEADVSSDLLAELKGEQQRTQTIKSVVWAVAFSLCLIAVVGALAYTGHQYLRSLVYVNRPARGAEPLDQYSDSITWVDPVEDRRRDLLRTGLGYGLICLAALLVVAGLNASAHEALAAIIALAGPAVGLLLYGRGESGHVGRCDDTLALVDHRDMYHLAKGARIHYRGPFLMVDDVVVFTGTALIPNLNPEQVAEQIYPLARQGARVDRKTALVKLLEVRHPIAVGVLACAASLVIAAVVLVAGSF
ncbi:hypothetical protein A3709_00545 [Halioglobus sp. HI00S01]|uniref:hypothetical protein n=1 Tax=Halioglobus sp. HI00S01 TaxID=1822214 RepID=UPI0007C31DE5|nr:hypothetical protein [Halioglobus sp. HI00S01]KZX60593.1 hypothetical protein A3709_00545 [Halioglobus sp. HI00S01]